MPYAAPPLKAEISATPSPTNAVAKAGFGKLHDWLFGLFGTTGQPHEALLAMRLLDPQSMYNLKLVPTLPGGSVLRGTVKANDGNAMSADNPGFLAFRNSNIADAGINLRKLTADLVLDVTNGATLGHVDNVDAPLYWYIIEKDAATWKLAVAGSYMGQSGRFTTTLMSIAADLATVLYADEALADKPGRLAFISWDVQAVAGTWAALPWEMKGAPFDLQKVGEVVDYMGGAVDYGFFLQDGQNVNRVTYRKLFARIGIAGGAGDGVNTFGVGDSRRKTLVGSGGTGTGTLGNAVGNTGGAETHTLITAEIPAHSHQVGIQSEVIMSPAAVSEVIRSGGPMNTGNTGGNGAHNNLPPSLVVTRMICWLGDI